MWDWLARGWRGRSSSDIIRITYRGQWFRVAGAFARNIGNGLLRLLLSRPLHWYMRRKGPYVNDPRSVLVVALNKGIGDAVLYLPMLKALRRAYQNSHITLLTTPSANEIISDNVRFDEMLLYPQNRRVGYWALLRKVRRRYDVVIDLLCSSRIVTGVLCLLSGARCLIGADLGAHGLFFSIKVPVDFNWHITEFFSDILRALDITEAYGGLHLKVKTQDLASVERTLRIHGIDGDDFIICIHPGARDGIPILDKRWAVESYQILCRELVRRHKHRLIVIGSEDEEGLCEEVRRAAPEGIISLAGKVPLRCLPALIQRCDLFIGNNSGPLHIAAAVDTPSISFSGGVNIARWAPLGDPRKHSVIPEKPGEKAPPEVVLRMMGLNGRENRKDLLIHPTESALGKRTDSPGVELIGRTNHHSGPDTKSRAKPIGRSADDNREIGTWTSSS